MSASDGEKREESKHNIRNTKKHQKTTTSNTDINPKILLKLKKINNLSESKRKFNLFNFFSNRLFINKLIFFKNFTKKLCLLMII
jgi:hypothetical protein